MEAGLGYNHSCHTDHIHTGGGQPRGAQHCAPQGHVGDAVQNTTGQFNQKARLNLCSVPECLQVGAFRTPVTTPVLCTGQPKISRKARPEARASLTVCVQKPGATGKGQVRSES